MTSNGVDYEEAKDMEIVFCTANRESLLLLSVYEHEGSIIIDIGDITE